MFTVRQALSKGPESGMMQRVLLRGALFKGFRGFQCRQPRFEVYLQEGGWGHGVKAVEFLSKKGCKMLPSLGVEQCLGRGWW